MYTPTQQQCIQHASVFVHTLLPPHKTYISGGRKMFVAGVALTKLPTCVHLAETERTGVLPVKLGYCVIQFIGTPPKTAATLPPPLPTSAHHL